MSDGKNLNEILESLQADIWGSAEDFSKRILEIEYRIGKTEDQIERHDLIVLLETYQKLLESQLAFEKNRKTGGLEGDREIKFPKWIQFVFHLLLVSKSHDLSIKNIVSSVTINVLIVAMIFGMWVDFVPTGWLNCSVVMVSVCMGVVAIPLFTNWIKEKKNTYNYRRLGKLGYGLSVLSMPLVFSMVCWVLGSHAIPALFTFLVGEDKEYVVDLEKTKKIGRSVCAYPVGGEFLVLAFPNYICVNKSEYFLVGDNVPMKLTGKESFLGFYVSNYQLITKD